MNAPSITQPVKRTRSLKTKLIGTILALSIVPLLITSWLTFDSYMTSMKAQALKQLKANVNFKQFQLNDYFQDIKDQTQVFAGENTGYDAIGATKGVALTLTEFQAAAKTLAGSHMDYHGMTELFSNNENNSTPTVSLNRSYYDALHSEMHSKYRRFADKTGLQNIFLVADQGQVIYSINKTYAFGRNLLTDRQVHGALAQVFADVRAQSESQAFVFQDYSVNPNDGTYSAYIAIGKYDFGAFLGAIIYQMPLASLAQLIGDSIELSKTSKILVIGDDELVRAALQGSNSNESTTQSLALSFGKRFENNNISKQGNNNHQRFLEVSAPIKVFDREWSVITQIETSEAYQSIWQLALIVIAVISVAVATIILVAILTTKRMLSGVNRLTEVAQLMAAGDLNQQITTDRDDEIGRLATSFAAMRDALKSKIDKIRQQNNELLELDKLKDDILANTSHELRTPLTGIVGLSESLLAHVPDHKQRTLLHIIASGRRLSSLVNDILDAAKLKQKEIKLHPKSLNLWQLVDLDFSLSAPLIENSTIKFINDVDRDMTIYADENRVQQILQNLITNAVKFTHEGHIKVTAEVTGQLVEIHVKDSGIGIAAEQLTTIFDAFTQVDSSSTRQSGGTGLGLAITRQLVELHQGSIWVKSQPGVGSDFVFTLPLGSGKTENDEPLLPKVRSVETLAPLKASLNDSSTGFNILVVDDEPVNLEIVSNHLAASQCAVQTVTSGQQALDVITQCKPDLVLLDVMMPGLDGYQTCKAIRQHYSAFELPVIFITARVQLKDLVDAFDAGGNDYLSKPFFKDELLARVQIQVELTIGRQRMAKLQHFANNISQYHSHEDMAKAAFETLLPDPIVERAALFVDGAVQLTTHDDFNELPNQSEQKDELLLEQDGQVSQYLALSEHYILAAKFPKSSSEDWLRNLASQLKKSMEQVRRIVSDPEVNLIQSVIRPKLASIFYISVEKNYCSVFVEQDAQLKEEVHRIPLRLILLYFDKSEFTQVSRSMVVNSTKISGFDKAAGAVILQDKAKLPVSKKYLYEMKKSHPQIFGKTE